MSVLSEMERPVVGAPMAGGPTTCELVVAVSAVGGIGFLGSGYAAAADLAADIAVVRSQVQLFGVNLFVPSDAPIDIEGLRRYREELLPEAERFGVTLPAIVPEPDAYLNDFSWADKLDLLAANPVPIVSFTFGIPGAGVVAPLQKAGSLVVATITSPQEAARAIESGVDALVAQGGLAGGHSATTTPDGYLGTTGTVDLVRAVRAVTNLPVIAAGGIGGSTDLAAVLDAGASAGQIGTLLLRATEAGTRPVHSAAFADPRFGETVVTRAFTGRPARALRNRFTDEHSAGAPFGFPAVHFLTGPIRRAAAAVGDAEVVNLWAGAGFRAARNASARVIVTDLADGV
ncbi:MAG: nitronate monooxygenase [Terrimesophilobacter sp.]